MHQMTRIFRATSVRLFVLGMFILLLSIHPAALMAQTAGEGTITGTVTDTTGAVVAGATVTATNQATNIANTRTTSNAGLYTIAPILPGIYTVTVTAKGFKVLKQENLDVVALNELGFNPVLAIGDTSESVVVTAAPPVLDTASAFLGAVVESETYAGLPIVMSTGAARDPTAFANLVPGAQGTNRGASRTPVIGGTANYNGYLYLDGVPSETINQQGDNRTVALNVSMEAVDQFQVNTSVPPAEYMGAGSMNFTIKSGSLKFHGQAAEFVRNTVFDAYSFTSKWIQRGGINPATGVNYPTCSDAPSTATVNGSTVNYAPRVGCLGKPIEHTNELSGSFGGYVPHAAHKVFFFFAYDKYHSRIAQNPVLATVPTALMEQGNFTELANGSTFMMGGQNGGANATTNKPFIYDPTSSACVGSVCTRQAFTSTSCSTCNGVPTNNVIPTGDISPITQKMESFMPNYPGSPNANLAGLVNPAVYSNNFLTTGIGGKDSHLYDFRVDFDINARNRISAVGAMGQFVYANNFGSPYLPTPYEVGDYAIIVPKQYDVEDAFTINDHLTNQFKWGYTRFYMPIINPTDTAAGYGSTSQTIGAFGVTNLPGGQAGTEFPGVTFGTSKDQTVGPATWTTATNSASTQLTIPNNYSLVDNLQWVKGRHVITFGATYQFEGLNNANPATFTGVLSLPFNQSPTANYSAGTSNIDTSTTGYGYASFLLGAVDPINLPLQNVATIYSRIKAIGPFVEDSYKVNEKLVVDLGLRWDYLPPLHEKFDHFTFLNPVATNSATNTLGALEFAGSYGGSAVSCGCKTPVSTYYKNFGPRLGINYSINDKTVVRGAIAIVYSQGGGTGGGRVSGNGGSNGAGQALGFNTTAVSPNDITAGQTAGPSFWLSSNAGYLTGAIAGQSPNTSLFGPGYAYPAAPAFGAASTILDAGNYLTSGGAFVTAAAMGYEDPYSAGRAPMYTFWNLGFERTVTKDITLQVNYVGDESHHAFDGNSQNARGYWNNQLNPNYLALLGAQTGKNSGGTSVSLLTAPATTANIAILDGVIPTAPNPAFFIAAANANPSNSGVTIGQMLTSFPQYSSLQDGLGGAYTDNFSYEALQLVLSQRTAHGLTFNVNYTYAKNIGDDGSFRSGYNIPQAAIDGNGQAWHENRIDRSWTSTSLPQMINAFGVYKIPLGTAGHFGSDHFVTRQLLGGWQVSGIYTYSSGTPVVVTWGQAGNCANAAPNAGQCQASLNPAFSGSARINGSYGSGPNGFNACNIGIGSGCVATNYIANAAFKQPTDLSTVPGTTHQYLIGNEPRSLPLNLRNPGTEDVDAQLRRTFPLPGEHVALVFEADCQNIWNKVTFAGPNGSWGLAASPTNPGTFGQVTNANGVGPGSTPRDWQFAGRVTF
jgi:hypothetical protein